MIVKKGMERQGRRTIHGLDSDEAEAKKVHYGN